jgi:hypothetical protein
MKVGPKESLCKITRKDLNPKEARKSQQRLKMKCKRSKTVKVVSSWKGPELERALKVQFLERCSRNLLKRSGLANVNLFKIMSLTNPQESLKLLPCKIANAMKQKFWIYPLKQMCLALLIKCL